MTPDGKRGASSSEAIFPRLPAGRGSRRSPERVASHQRARLQGAMVEAVARNGFRGTSVSELASLAGVSNTAFYRLYPNKKACFLDTFEEIMSRTMRQVGEAYREAGDDPRAGINAALSVFMGLSVEVPGAANLAAVESLSLGAAGVEQREQASEAFAVPIGQSLERAGGERQVGGAELRAIVAGIRGVVYRHMRSGRTADLPGTASPLTDWALSYTRPDSPATERAIAAALEPAPRPEEDPDAIPFSEPPDSPTARARLTQRERIIRAAARVAVERGYEGLSIPAISKAAGVSNKTLYDEFDGKESAFLAAFDALIVRARDDARASYRPEAGAAENFGASVKALLTYISGEPIFARLAFFELTVAGPAALDRADAALDAFTAFLAPGRAPTEFGGALAPAVLEAVPSGVWAVLQREIVVGRLADLPSLAPDICRIVLGCFPPD